MKLMVLPSLLLMVAFLVYIHGLRRTIARQPVNPVQRSHTGCTRYIDTPLVYICPRRVYLVEHGKWRDIGPVTTSYGLPLR